MAEIWGIIEKDLEPLRQAIAAVLPPLKELEAEIAGGEDEPAEA